MQTHRLTGGLPDLERSRNTEQRSAESVIERVVGDERVQGKATGGEPTPPGLQGKARS